MGHKIWIFDGFYISGQFGVWWNFKSKKLIKAGYKNKSIQSVIQRSEATWGSVMFMALGRYNGNSGRRVLNMRRYRLQQSFAPCNDSLAGFFFGIWI